MHRVTVDRLQPSQVLGKTVHDEQGQVLLAEGVVLTETLIEALRSHGFTAVYVRDGLADDVAPADLLSERVRAMATQHLQALFCLSAERRPSESTRARLEWPSQTQRVVASLYQAVEAIMEEVLTAEALQGMAGLKSHDSYTFEHSLETAVIGVMLGRRLGLQHADLRQLGLGCLLHDIGKASIPLAILNKPDPLTPEECQTIRRHPRTGYELVASLELESTIPRHIAWQHHERQDGGGYPRGLRGTNRVARTARDLATPGRIMLLAELTSVADVYSALTSDRPYRPAMAPDKAASLMRGAAGAHLNHEVVQAFFRVVPTYPVGLRVLLSGGPFDGWRGVVAAVQPPTLDRPTVRLLLDSAGRQVAPDEVDLRRLPDVTLCSESLAMETVG